MSLDYEETNQFKVVKPCDALLKEFAAKHPEIVWIDFGEKLVDASGWVPKGLMRDGIHPSAAGYDVWMDAILPVVDAKAK